MYLLPRMRDTTDALNVGDLDITLRLRIPLASEEQLYRLRTVAAAGCCRLR